MLPLNFVTFANLNVGQRVISAECNLGKITNLEWCGFGEDHWIEIEWDNGNFSADYQYKMREVLLVL